MKSNHYPEGPSSMRHTSEARWSNRTNLLRRMSPEVPTYCAAARSRSLLFLTTIIGPD
jgi:hypothetical protein